MKKQKFEIRIAVGGDDETVDVNMQVWKDGKISDFRLFEGENMRIAYESLKHALGITARIYLEHLHKEGQVDDEQDQKFHTK